MKYIFPSFCKWRKIWFLFEWTQKRTGAEVPRQNFLSLGFYKWSHCEQLLFKRTTLWKGKLSYIEYFSFISFEFKIIGFFKVWALHKSAVLGLYSNFICISVTRVCLCVTAWAHGLVVVCITWVRTVAVGFSQ